MRRLLALAAVVLCLVSCSQLTTEDKIRIGADSVRIDMCVAKTHACKLASGDAAAALCWPVYDECMVGAGMRDGGATKAQNGISSAKDGGRDE